MQHRAQDGAAVAWNEGLESEASPSDLEVASSVARVAIGHGFTKVVSNDIPQPMRARGGWFCLDGRIVVGRALVGGEEAARALDPRMNSAQFSSIQHDIDGAYSIYFCSDKDLLVVRDSLGLKPTFIGRGDGFVAVASDRKALWALGISEVTTLPPGGCLKAGSDSVVIEHPDLIPAKAQMSFDDKSSVHDLSRSLVESVMIQTAHTEGVAVGFSGGVDSTVIAKIAKDLGVDVLLIAIGIGQTPEVIQAESTAKEMGLPIVVKHFSMYDLDNYLDRVLWLIEEPNLMKLSVAIAVHWIAETAGENGRPLIMLGQGSDELFGGYKKFASILGERGAEAASEAISRSIRAAYEVNYQRDEQAISSLRAELRLPFATRKMTEIASRTPLRMKVRSSSDNVRKWILREAAVELGVPSAVAMRPKRAVQHASGIEKAIREVARMHGQAASAYLEGRFRILRKDLGARLGFPDRVS